jgi:3-isopropylmalate/(R)-2-methylmalate dehydratase small subunit
MADFEWTLKGRCYKLGDDVSHAGGVVPNWLISGRYTDPKEIVPHLFEETDPGFHERCKPGDIIVAGRNFGMGPKARSATACRS